MKRFISLILFIADLNYSIIIEYKKWDLFSNIQMLFKVSYTYIIIIVISFLIPFIFPLLSITILKII